MGRDLLRQGNRFATVEAYQERLKIKSSFLECIGVGDGKDGFVYLICNDCGNVFHKSKSKVRPSRANRLICPHCEDVLLSIRIKEREIEKTKIRLKAERQRELIRAEKNKIKYYKCARCGIEFTGRKRKYCSDVCARRQFDSDKEHLRRIRINNIKADSISLELLEQRDKCKCWICGGRTDRTDYDVRPNGTFVAHGSYPSIDHVVPLAKGGTHTWNNVRLAHKNCNSRKRDSLIIEDKDSQMRFVI